MSLSTSSFHYYEVCSYAAGIAGNLFALVLFISPMPTFKRIIENRSTERFSGLLYIYSLLNCLICAWYGLPWVTQGAVLVATVNSAGALFHLIYSILFTMYSDRRKKIRMSVLILGVLSVFFLIVCLSLKLVQGKDRQNFVGYLSIVSLVSMFASPLFIISLVIRTKSVEFMPFHISLATFFMSIAFFSYGVLLGDFYIYVPNGIGTLLAILQLLVYAYFSKKTQEDCKLPLIVS